MAKNNAVSSAPSISCKSLIPTVALLAGIVVALNLVLHPNGEEQHIKAPSKKTIQVKKQKVSKPLASGYNEPFQPHKTTSVFASGSYIYWQPSQQNFFIGQKFNQPLDLSNSDSAANFRRRTKDFNFQYESGFKVGFGAQFPEDNWSLYAEYVRLHTHQHTTIGEIAPNFAQSAWIPVDTSSVHNITSSEMSNSWGFHFDLLDLNLLRACYVGKKLILSPFITGRGVWIRQSLIAKTSYITNTQSFSEQGSYKQRSLQIGPRIGTDIDWLLGCGFKFSGKVGAAILYNRNQSKHSVPFSYTNIYFLDNFSMTQGSFCPNLDFAVGFGWESKKHFGISASYDILTFFNQNNLGENHILSDTSGTLQIPSNTLFGFEPQNNLTMHGLTVTMSYAF